MNNVLKQCELPYDSQSCLLNPSVYVNVISLSTAM